MKAHKADITKALNSKDPEKKYINIVERIVKQVYFTGAPVSKPVGQGMTGYMLSAAPNCQTGVANHNGRDPIRPLMCIFMKYGYLLDDFSGSASGSNANVRKMIDKLFPVLISRSASGVFDKAESTLAIKHLWAATDPADLLSGDPEQGIRTLDKIYSVSMFLALSSEDFEARIMEHLAESKAKAALEELENKKANCAKVKWTGSFAMGLTVGGSTVGFCTPDTNPFQALWSTAFERTGAWKGGKCKTSWSAEHASTYIVAGSIYFQVAMTKYLSKKKNEYRVSFRLPLNTGESAFTTAGQAPSPSPPLVGAMRSISTYFDSKGMAVNGLSSFESFVAGLFTTLVDSTSRVRDNGVLQALAPTITGNGAAMKLIQSILKALPFTNPLSCWSSGNREQLLGFDIERTAGDQKKTIRIVQHSYLWAQGTIPAPIPGDPTFSVTLTGSSGTEQFFEFQV